jgi:hypothetical protein
VARRARALVCWVEPIAHRSQVVIRQFREEVHMSNTQPAAADTGVNSGGGSPAARGNGFGVAALILGIFSLVFAFVPFVSYAAVGAGAIAVILAVVGLTRKFRARGTSVAGLITGVIGLILAIVMTTMYAAVFFGISKVVNDTNKAASASHTVVYSVTGAAQDADVTYSTFTNGTAGTEQSSSTPLPFTKTITVKGSKDSLAFNSFDLTATNGMNDTGTISCQLTVDGKTISSQTSSGSLASVNCSGTN